jgi:lysophospholipase L1-like esterase
MAYTIRSKHSIWDDLRRGESRTVVLYGTSLTIAEGPEASGAWVLEFRRWAKERFGDRLKIVNAAESARNSQWGLENLAERVIARHPDFVFIEFGMNDSYVPYACTLKQVERQIGELIRRIQEARSGVALMTMNPKIEDAVEPVAPAQHNLLAAFYRLYADAASRHQLDFIDHYSAWIARELREPGYLKNHIRDGVHPQGPATVEITWANLEAYLNEVTSI